MNLAARARTFVLVVGVALVIWLYAEAESLTRTEREVSVAIVSRAEDAACRVVDPNWRGAVRLRFEGSTAAIAKAPRSIELSPGDPAVPDEEGEHSVDLRTALGASDELVRTGVSLLSADPPSVRLRVSAIDRIPDADVRPEVSGVALAGAPLVEPPNVLVSGPRETLARLAGALGGAVVVARVPAQTAAGAEEGKPTRIPVRLTLPVGFDETDVTITPREAFVTITRGPGDVWQPPPPAVRILIPPAAAARWRVEPAEDQRFVRGVSLSGPPASVERFRSGELTLGALVSLSTDDLARGAQSKPVSFVAEKGGAILALPPGISVNAPETSISLTIEPVPGAAPAN